MKIKGVAGGSCGEGVQSRPVRGWGKMRVRGAGGRQDLR